MSNFRHLDIPQIPENPLDIIPDLSSRAKNELGLNQASPVNAGHWINSTAGNPPKELTTTSRRRRPSGPDHIKHRRTRNGCYTCRSRRVKCDEIRPVCERCQKGSRECTYPESRTNPTSSSASKRDQLRKEANDSELSSNEEDCASQPAPRGGRENEYKKTEKRGSQGSTFSKGSPSKTSSTQPSVESLAKEPRPSIEEVKQENGLSPSTEASSIPASAGLERPPKLSSASTEASQEDKPWSYLPLDLQYFLDYHNTNLTSHHYFFKHDASHFLHTILIQQALGYHPLLYAVVGFAAYQLTVKRPNGRIQDFLGYYNKSVSLLRRSLRGNERHTDATMLTILQLATFEDYLGDYVSLLGHQKAAYGMLMELYSSQTITETEIRRKILVWYSRFDVMGGLVSGYETVLRRDWFVALETYYRQQSLIYPASIDYKIEATIARHRLLAADLAQLFAQLPRGDITTDEFVRESDRFAEQISSWKDRLEPVFWDESYLVNCFGGREAGPEDIVNPYLPGGLYKGALFTLNFLLMDWCAINLIHRFKTASLQKLPPPPEVAEIALEICRISEAIEFWPESPAGAFLKTQGSLALAAIFLPKDHKHIMWCRRKFAKIESLGHIYPTTLRYQLAEVWGMPCINDSWLPDEGSCPFVIRGIHSFMGNRLPRAEEPSRSEDQRNIKGIFSKLSIHERSSSPESASTLTEDTSLVQSLVGPEIDVEMDTDDSMLDQSRESFFNMTMGDTEGQRCFGSHSST